MEVARRREAVAAVVPAPAGQQDARTGLKAE